MPTKKHIFAPCLFAAAKDELDGNNYANLARKYGFSVTYFRGQMKCGQKKEGEK